MFQLARTVALYLYLLVQPAACDVVTDDGHHWILSVSHDTSPAHDSWANDTDTETITPTNSGDDMYDNNNHKEVFQALFHVRFGMSVVGITGNFINIAVCLESNFRHLPVTPYMVALAVSDSIGLYSSVFVVAWKYYTGHTVPDLTKMCNVRWYINVVSLCTSAMLLCAISLQRMIAIRYPLHAKLWLKNRVTYMSLAAILLYATACFVPVTMMCDSQCRLRPGWPRFYLFNILTYHLLISNNILPDMILVVTNILLAISLKNSSFRQDSDSAVHGVKDNTVTKCAVMALTLALTHLLLTTPLAVHSILQTAKAYKENSAVEQIVQNPIYLLYTANHAINFFLCVATSSSFRRSLRSLFSCRNCCQRRLFGKGHSSDTISTNMGQVDTMY